MPNQDYPGVCMACTTPECNVEAADVSAYAKRIREIELPHYTEAIVNNLVSAMPDKFANKEEAYMAFDVMKAIIAMGLKDADTVGLEGIGEFRVEKAGGRKNVVFTPERVLADMVNE